MQSAPEPADPVVAAEWIVTFLVAAELPAAAVVRCVALVTGELASFAVDLRPRLVELAGLSAALVVDPDAAEARSGGP